MILGEYPFLGDTLQDTYDRVRFISTSHPLILLHKLNVTYFQPILKKSKLDVFLLFQIVNNPIEIPDDINPQLKNLIEGLLCKGTWHSTSVSSYQQGNIITIQLYMLPYDWLMNILFNFFMFWSVYRNNLSYVCKLFSPCYNKFSIIAYENSFYISELIKKNLYV